MNIPAHPTRIKAMIDSRVRKLAAQGPAIAASLVTIERCCGQPGCRCQRGEKHKGHYLTFKQSGKTRTVYVPVGMLEEVSVWVDEHKRLKKLSQEVSQLAIELVRSHVTTRRRKAARP